MIRPATPILALALGAATAFGLVSCGGDDTEGLLPSDTAEEIRANLEEVDELADAGDCTEAIAAAGRVQSQIAELGDGVAPRLREALADGAEQLLEVTSADCVEEVPPPPPPPEEEPTTTTTTTTDEDDEGEEEEDPEETTNGEETTIQPPPPPGPLPPPPPPEPQPVPPPPSNGGGIGPGVTP